MKTIASLVIALATFMSVPTAARACDYAVTYYAPVLVSTCEVSRSYGCRTAYDYCGRPYSYSVVMVTFRSSYSDGSARVFTRVYRA